MSRPSIVATINTSAFAGLTGRSGISAASINCTDADFPALISFSVSTLLRNAE